MGTPNQRSHTTRLMIDEREQQRLSLQHNLDSQKTREERNQLGQFATPTRLAEEIIKFSSRFLEETSCIRWLDPAFGSGAFFTALLKTISPERIEEAVGFEIDPLYANAVPKLWSNSLLQLILQDFTLVTPPPTTSEKFNFLVCNPPYVRHHHISSNDKMRLQQLTENRSGIRLAGLAGLYCYFVGLAHTWMQPNAIASWLLPREFMDVNYGEPLKQYLTEKVTLLHIHLFDCEERQFEDALVSSTVIWFRNAPPPPHHIISMTIGGSLFTPHKKYKVLNSELKAKSKWSQLQFGRKSEQKVATHRLSDLFTIKRGVVTGSNQFFILNRQQLAAHHLPIELFRPILPSPRYLLSNEISADDDGLPQIEKQLYLLHCYLPKSEIETRYPTLWRYLESGKETVSQGYICRSRPIWYAQEQRDPAPILCSYMGRSRQQHSPFRFILNHSKAIAPNVYLLLYPKPEVVDLIEKDQTVLTKIWKELLQLDPQKVIQEGRIYGGGLHKIEPKELGNLNAEFLLEAIPELKRRIKCNVTLI